MTTSAPPLWWTVSAIACVALTTAGCAALLVESTEWTDWGAWFLALPLLVVAGGLWLTLAVTGWILYRTWRPALIAPLIVLCTGALLLTDIPHRASFAGSRSALADHAATCAPRGATWFRTVRVEEVAPLPNGVCAFRTPGGFIDRVGWAYVPDGVEVNRTQVRDGEYTFTHISGPWYRFVQYF